MSEGWAARIGTALGRRGARLHAALELRAVLFAVLLEPEAAYVRVCLWDRERMLVLYPYGWALIQAALEIGLAVGLAHAANVLPKLRADQPPHHRRRVEGRLPFSRRHRLVLAVILIL